jgi:hypothetical protein
MKIVGTTITGSVLVNENDITTNLQTLNVWSGSVASTIVSLNTTTSSLNNTTASLLNYTASQNNINGTYTTTSSFNAFTASQNNNNSKYATTGSNNFVGTQYVSNTTQATSFIATASLYTDGGLRVGKDAYISGSTYVAGNLVVFGTSSIQYVTSSALIGLEYIDLNTDTPALRYAGIRVYDSGSNVGVTGSLFWDSQTNHWIYANPSGSSYSGGMMISGPRASSLGSEQGTTNNALMRGQGGDHITSSAILDDGTSLRIPYLTIVTGTVGATTFSGSGANLTSIPNAALTNSTISGIALGSNLATLTIGTGLSGTSYNGSGAVTIANTGVTSIVAGTNISISGGTGAVTITNGITNNNQLTNGAGYITSAGTSADSNLLNGISAVNLFNNMGAAHGTRTSFDASTPSYGFGFRFVQGTGNGPATGGGSQFYSWYIGLGGEYPATGGGSYGMHVAIPRAASTPYMSVRYNENNSLGSWIKIAAGYADSAGSVSDGMYLSGTQVITGQKQFQSNRNTSGDSPPLQAYSTGGSGAIMSFHRGGAYAINMGLDSDNVFRIGGWSASTNRLQMDMSGNLTMAGDVTAFSDARVKENVVTVDNALSKLLALRGVYYNRTDSDDKRTKLGVIAQEILKVIPEVVNQDNDGMYNVSYGNLAGLFIEAIKEQQAQIEELKAKLG